MATRIKRTLTSIGKRSSSLPAKAAVAAAAAASKENLADVPTGANFAPTPIEAWGGSAVVRSSPPRPSPRAIDRARAAKKKRAADNVAAAAAATAAAAAAHQVLKPPPSPGSLVSPEQVRSFEWDDEQTLLDGWSLAFNGSRPLQLSGRVYNNDGPGLEDGDAVEYTSQVVGVKGRVATTKSGTRYYLGAPSDDFEAVRVQLLRQTAAAEHGGPAAAAAVPVPFDAERPFTGIELGAAVASSSVKLPSVQGWAAASNVALLHEWTLERGAAGYNVFTSVAQVAVIGTVFNCPGMYDGTAGYRTAAVVEVQGRLVRTADDRTFYLGRRASGGGRSAATNAPAVDEATELGEIDDLLSV